MMILSVEELKKFCENPYYHLCAVYQRFQKSGEKIPIKEHKQYKSFVGV
jgi:hypothetical protein